MTKKYLIPEYLDLIRLILTTYFEVNVIMPTNVRHMVVVLLV